MNFTKIKQISSFRDGGTIYVIMESGQEFFIDRRIGTSTKNSVFDKHPNTPDAVNIDDTDAAKMLLGEICTFAMVCVWKHKDQE